MGIATMIEAFFHVAFSLKARNDLYLISLTILIVCNKRNKKNHKVHSMTYLIKPLK